MNIEDLYTKDRHEAGAEMQVISESGMPLDMYISLVGADSATKKAAGIVLNRNVAAGKDPGDERINALVSSSLSWRGFESGGKELEFSPESMKNFYINCPYIADQADSFIANRVNFMKGKDAKLKNTLSGASTSSATKKAAG